MGIADSNVLKLVRSLNISNEKSCSTAVRASQGVTKTSGKGIYKRLREYFYGNDFESDLDKYISFAEYFSKSKAPEFFKSLDNEDRIKAKLHYAKDCSQHITSKIHAYSGSSGVFYGHGEMATAAGMAEGILVMVAADTLIIIDVRSSDPVILEVRPIEKK